MERSFKITTNYSSITSDKCENPEEAWNMLRLKLIDSGRVSLVSEGVLHVLEKVCFSNKKKTTYWKPIYKDMLENSYENHFIEDLSSLKV